MKLRLAITAALATASLPFIALDAGHAQLGNLGRAIGTVAGNPLGRLVSGPQPVSTSIADATYGDPAKDRFTPPGRALPLTGRPRTATGGFVLAAGFYEMRAQSYCLHAGTHGPGGGDGYLYAPVLGSARDAVTSILQNSVAHPDIAQHDIQVLLWAIVARAKFEDLEPRLKLIAAQLLTQRQLAGLNRSALSVLNSSQLQGLVAMPPFVRQVLTAESDMRRLVTLPGAAYSDMERVAVLGGMAPRGEGSVDTPATRWSLHPDGYWVRYTPTSYSNTLVQIWVAPGSTAIGKTYDPGQHIAVPGNTSRQRLAQSGREYGR
ncbi:MAG: hypothetical protein ACKOUM_03640 [Sphingopyxis sp.]